MDPGTVGSADKICPYSNAIILRKGVKLKNCRIQIHADSIFANTMIECTGSDNSLQIGAKVYVLMNAELFSRDTGVPFGLAGELPSKCRSFLQRIDVINARAAGLAGKTDARASKSACRIVGNCRHHNSHENYSHPQNWSHSRLSISGWTICYGRDDLSPFSTAPAALIVDAAGNAKAPTRTPKKRGFTMYTIGAMVNDRLLNVQQALRKKLETAVARNTYQLQNAMSLTATLRRKRQMCKAVWSILTTGLLFFSACASAMTYATNFANTENPISEGGNWQNGAANGVDWTNCRSKPGLVFGTEIGTGRNQYQYDDSTSILTGTWGPLQTVQATVFSQNQSRTCLQEVELRLHSTMTAHSSTGYEVLFRAYHPGGYATIVRWNGALGDFTYLNQQANGNYHGIQTGDVVKATIDGNGLIIGCVNGVEVIRATDTTYTGGNPGIGFWLQVKSGEGQGTNADYGFSAFTATDGVSSPERQ
jgi:hypothetical protein